jgi:DNA-3-methyladenine glycosylase
VRPVAEAARALLGSRLVSTVGGLRTEGVVVECEAYGGPEDPASHACVKAGRTRRNSPMFGPPGTAYVYRSHGVHWCVNVVTGATGDPQAVLVRGIEPLSGVETMAERRMGRAPLAAGPGRLCQALAIDGSHNGHDLSDPPLRLRAGWHVPDGLVGVSGRVGVGAAAQSPLRFYVVGSSGVSRAPTRMERG